jgi:hypothetical protein
VTDVQLGERSFVAVTGLTEELSVGDCGWCHRRPVARWRRKDRLPVPRSVTLGNRAVVVCGEPPENCGGTTVFRP